MMYANKVALKQKKIDLNVSHFGQHQRRRKLRMLFLLANFYNRRKSSDFLLHRRSYKLSRDKHWTAQNESRQTKIQITQLCSIFFWASILGSWRDAVCIALPPTDALKSIWIWQIIIYSSAMWSKKGVQNQLESIAVKSQCCGHILFQSGTKSSFLQIKSTILDDNHRIFF